MTENVVQISKINGKLLQPIIISPEETFSMSFVV